MTDTVHEPYLRLINSDRVGANTRNALLERSKPDAPDYQPTTLTPAHLKTLRSVLDRVLPQGSEPSIDLAARIDQQLSEGTGDGWRRAELPCDAQAYTDGLDTLNGITDAKYQQQFSDLAAAQQDEILAGVIAGAPAAPGSNSVPARFSIRQLQLWFEDLRADATRLYVAHPATLERMGYSGIANGGDGQPKSGFVRIGLDQREAWEPSRKP